MEINHQNLIVKEIKKAIKVIEVLKIVNNIKLIIIVTFLINQNLKLIFCKTLIITHQYMPLKVKPIKYKIKT